MRPSIPLLKSGLRKGLSIAGYDLVRSGPPNSAPVSAGSLASHLHAMLAGLQVECVIDVGAHVGEFGRFLRRIGYKGQIISLEPVQECFRELASLAGRDGNWLAFCLAAGSASGSLTFNVAGETELSSFLEPNQLAGEVLRSAAVAERHLVDVVRLDEFISSLELPRSAPIFLKMDTQGWDLEVVRGTESLSSQIVALQSEVAFRPLYANAPDFVTALSYFNELGFRVSGLFPVSIDYRDFSAIEYDCVFVKAPDR